ncbi:MAG: hypothetical protein Fur0032_02340 [Terrimicrobiaceae bacterium]
MSLPKIIDAALPGGKYTPMIRALISSLVVMLWSAGPVAAELPPSVYEEKQKNAAEHLKVQVVRVEISPGEAEGSQSVELVALVTAVNRSAAQLTPGQLLTVRYVVQSRPRGFAGPGEIPILDEGAETVAYLNPIEGTDSYAPAAGVMSFRDF